MTLENWLKEYQQYPTDVLFSIPEPLAQEFEELNEQFAGFTIDSLMQFILRDGFSMNQDEFISGIIDEHYIECVVSHCHSLGIDYEKMMTHELGSAVKSVAENGVVSLAKISLSVRDSLIESNLPIVEELGCIAYQFVAYSSGGIHVSKLPIEDVLSVFKFRGAEETCHKLSTLINSMTKSTKY